MAVNSKKRTDSQLAAGYWTRVICMYFLLGYQMADIKREHSFKWIVFIYCGTLEARSHMGSRLWTTDRCDRWLEGSRPAQGWPGRCHGDGSGRGCWWRTSGWRLDQREGRQRMTKKDRVILTFIYSTWGSTRAQVTFWPRLEAQETNLN